jgi:RNA polymerase sigma-70 factor (ECF subfamily)
MSPSHPRDERTDAELIEAIQGGDPDAFDLLYYRHRDWVVTQAYRFSGNREDALDVLQDTFAYVLKKLPSLVLRGQMRSFLFPVVKHRALDRKAARTRLGVTGTIPEPPAKEVAAQGSEELALEETRRLLGRLPEEESDVLWLRFVDGLRLREIAEALGIPLGTVKSRLHNGLASLREGRRRRR